MFGYEEERDDRGFQFNGQPMGQSQKAQVSKSNTNRSGSNVPREMDPTRQSVMPVSMPTQPKPDGNLHDIIMQGVPKAFQTPSGPQGNGVDAREALGGYAPIGQMNGFNMARDYGPAGPDASRAANSVKNTFGRIASRYTNDRMGLEQLMRDPDFMRYFPNARLGAEEGRGGVIDFGGVLSEFESGTPVGAVDVLQAYDGTNSTGWQWIDQNFAPPTQNAHQVYDNIQQSIMQPQAQGADQNQLFQLLQMLLGQNMGRN